MRFVNLGSLEEFPTRAYLFHLDFVGGEVVFEEIAFGKLGVWVEPFRYETECGGSLFIVVVAFYHDEEGDNEDYNIIERY